MTRSPLYDTTALPASETPEGRERLSEYWAALGQFVHWFTQADCFLTLSLWRYAKKLPAEARVEFSGATIAKTISLIRENSTDIKAATKADLNNVLNQIGIINSARNDLLHCGAMNVAEGNAFVTNAVRAAAVGKIRLFKISPEILTEMSADLRKIVIHLHARHLGRPEPRGKMAVEMLQAGWQYRHNPQPIRPARKPEIRPNPTRPPKPRDPN